MATSIVYPGLTGSQTDFTIPFEYLSRDHVKVTLDGVLTTSFDFLSASIIQMDTAPTGELRIFRETPTDQSLVNWTDGSILLDDDLNLGNLQTLYVAEELEDKSFTAGLNGHWNATNLRVEFMTEPVASTDGATKNYVDTRLAADISAINADRVAGEAARTGAEAAQVATEAARDATLDAFDSFDDRYLGSFATNPTVDNDGDPLAPGMLHWNTGTLEMRVYNGTSWVAAYVSGSSFLPLTGGTLTGNLNGVSGYFSGALYAEVNFHLNRVGKAGAAYFYADADVGHDSGFVLRSYVGGSVKNRWLFTKGAEAETGGDAGGNLHLVSYTDAGSYKDTPIHINRSSSLVTVKSLDVVNKALVRSNLGVDYGKQTIFIPASALNPHPSGPPEDVDFELGNQGQLQPVKRFDPNQIEYCGMCFPIPNSLDVGAAVDYRFIWRDVNPSPNGVVWYIGFTAFSSGEDWNVPVASFSAVTSGSPNIANRVVHTPWQAKLIDGTPAKGDYVSLIAFRHPGHADDTHPNDVDLIGIELRYSTDSNKDN